MLKKTDAFMAGENTVRLRMLQIFAMLVFEMTDTMSWFTYDAKITVMDPLIGMVSVILLMISSNNAAISFYLSHVSMTYANAVFF